VYKTLRLLGFGIFFAVSVFLPSVASASNYGAGNYSACNYQDGCAVSKDSDSETQTVELESDTTRVVLNNYDAFFIDAGVTITNLKIGDILNFCIISSTCTETKTDFHTITVTNLDLSDPSNPVITLTFSSSPFDVTFVKGDVKKIDVNQDGTNDIEVTFVDVVNGHAILTTKNLSKTNNVVTSADETVTQKTSKAWIWAVAILITIITLFIIIRLV
jgi:hypothetical protein